MRWNKKAALELSITAIVVLIIAITVLGLAIFFIKNLFKGGTEIFTGELAKIKDQLRKNLEESGELVVFSKGTLLEAKRGEKVDFYIGVRNTGTATKCYRIAMRCIKPFTPVDQGGQCTDAAATDALVGGVEVDGVTRPTGTENWFPRILSEFDIRGGDIEVIPVTLQVVGKPDTYLGAADIYEANADCATATTWPARESPWQSKRFHVILS